MKRLPVLIIVILFLCTACVGWYAQSLQQELGRLQQSGLSDAERANWKKRVAELERRLAAAAAKAPASIETALGEAEEPPMGEPGEFGPPGMRPEQGRGGRRDGRSDRLQALANNPEYQKLMSAQQRGAVEGRYSALFKGLNLAPAELDKFKALLADKQSAVFDVLTAARTQGLTGRENQDQVRQMIQTAQGEVDQSIQQLLGQQAYSQYQNYESTTPQRATVDQLEKRLSYTQTPLTEQQSQQLINILASGGNQRASGSAGPRNALGFGGSAPAPIKDQSLQLAQGILAAPQMEALQQMQQEQKAAQQLARLMRGGGQGNSALAPAAPASKGGN